MSNTLKPSIFRRALTATATLGVVAIATGAVMGGSDFIAQRAEAVPAPAPAVLTSVAVQTLRYTDGYTMTRRFLGQVEAGADAAVSFELSGRLAELAVDEGAVVKRGDVLARLDTVLLDAEEQRLRASRDATAAQLAFAESRVIRATELLGDGFSSQETLDQAIATRDELQARIAEIEAGLLTVSINREKSVLVAPFDGRVGQQTVEVTETLSPGQPVLTLIETAAPKVRIGLPLDIDPNALDAPIIEIEGTPYPATLHRVRPDIDPVTRTRTAIFAVGSDVPLTFGQTASLAVASDVGAQGVWVPLDALQEGSGSIWTVLVVDGDTVRAAAVELLHAEADRAFVRGTFADGAQLIRTGAHRVVPGQKVTTNPVEG
ncbi:MAG: efflux RND transporter periplasmic adaptor subunit [Pseudomonadota bacterium]